MMPRAVVVSFLASLSSTAVAQSLGDWSHNAISAPADVYVGPNTNPTPTGTSASDPVTTLAAALALADGILSQGIGSTAGVTINVMPGTYTPTSPLQVPAFGVSIEPYRDLSQPVNAPVVMDLSLCSNGQAGCIQVLESLPPLTTSAAQTAGVGTSGFAPSELRGLTFTQTIETVLYFDVSASVIATSPGDTIDFGVHQCEFIGQAGAASNVSRLIFAAGGTPERRLVITDNTMTGHVYGVWLTGQGSDMILRNDIRTQNVGIFVDSAGSNNDLLYPRVMCNMISGQDGPGIWVQGASAHIASNSIAFTVSALTPLGAEGAILLSANTSVPLPTVTIVNNILFNPGIIEVNVAPFGPAWPVPPTFESNYVESPTPIAGPGNVVLPGSPFVSPADLHLAAVPTDPADLNYALVTAASQISFAGGQLPASINADFDGDSRAHQAAGAAGAQMHRGADQLMSDGLRLRYAQVVSSSSQAADAFGNIVANVANGFTSRVDLELDLPASTQSVWIFYVSEIGLQGPEFTQAFVNPYGISSLSPASALSFASTPSGGQTTGTVSATLDLGVAALDFCEAELYVQCFIIRSDNTGSFSNRLRVDLDLDL